MACLCVGTPAMPMAPAYHLPFKNKKIPICVEPKYGVHDCILTKYWTYSHSPSHSHSQAQRRSWWHHKVSKPVKKYELELEADLGDTIIFDLRIRYAFALAHARLVVWLYCGGGWVVMCVCVFQTLVLLRVFPCLRGR